MSTDASVDHPVCLSVCAWHERSSPRESTRRVGFLFALPRHASSRAHLDFAQSEIYPSLFLYLSLSLSLSLFRFALCVLISFYRSPSCHGSFPLRALLNQREMGERTNDRPLLGLTCPGRVVWDVPYTSARGINEWNWVQRYIGTYYTTVEVTTFASRTTRIFPKLAFGVRVISACS